MRIPRGSRQTAIPGGGEPAEFGRRARRPGGAVEKICGTCFPGLRAEGFYRQPSGDSELLTIYAVNRADDNTCPVNLAARLHLGRDEYAWIDRLLEDLSLCEREALLYITQGKRLGMERFVEIGNTSDEPLNTAA